MAQACDSKQALVRVPRLGYTWGLLLARLLPASGPPSEGSLPSEMPPPDVRTVNGARATEPAVAAMPGVGEGLSEEPRTHSNPPEAPASPTTPLGADARRATVSTPLGPRVARAAPLPGAPRVRFVEGTCAADVEGTTLSGAGISWGA